jgi:hypothetical protein
VCLLCGITLFMCVNASAYLCVCILCAFEERLFNRLTSVGEQQVTRVSTCGFIIQFVYSNTNEKTVHW